MQRTFEAVYENGLLRPLESLPLAERQRVSLTLDANAPISDDDLLDHELLLNLDSEELPSATLEQVQTALAKISGSMTADFLAEREERF